jgi:hypothetical protein
VTLSAPGIPDPEGLIANGEADRLGLDVIIFARV